MPRTLEYLKSVGQALAAGNATEHTHRPALKSFIESFDPDLVATNEPKHTKVGAPDLIVTRGPAPVGYVEAKDVGASLDRAEASEQLQRYLGGLENLLLTDYLEFRWYVRGERVGEARLATYDAQRERLRPETGGDAEVEQLITHFLTEQNVKTVSSPKELAERMARVARLIRDTILRAFRTEGAGGSLHEQLKGFREVLLHDLDEERFADMYAQTICYGLFAARVNHRGGQPFSRRLAAHELPRTNPFLRRLFQHVAGPDLDDEPHAWAVDGLAELLNRTNVGAILQDFGRATRREDPVVHFYETFLAAYDPRMREARGVYYTPEPVVSYIVRSVDHILKSDFRLRDGLADSSKVKLRNSKGRTVDEVHKVLILDPATGTGTFLHGVVAHIHESFRANRGMWSSYVSEHLLPRLFGFELLMAPYAVAHMKLGLQLAETGYEFNTDERLRVYLTNTLEEAHEYANLPLFAREIADEANAASKIKQDLPIMVVIGNPPYSVSSQNKGKWISELIEDYKKDLKEKKTNLDDDFIKFIRFAQWRIEQTGYGIVALITNHTYLDGVTHRRMRESLLETFDNIYILDLHGNSKRREKSPDGSKDENVFDIQQGVAISIFVKTGSAGNAAKVFHSDLWGLRPDKYARLNSLDVSSTGWRELEDLRRESCLGKFYFFAPVSFDNIDEYCEGWSVKDCFDEQNTGIQTKRDELFIDFDRNQLAERFRDVALHSEDIPYLKNKYGLEDSSGWSVSKLRGLEFKSEALVQVLYRPFDVRWLYFEPKALGRARESTMLHMLATKNLGLVTLRINEGEEDFVCLCTRNVVEKGSLPRGNYSLFPLYLQSPDIKANLFETDAAAGRRANLTPEFIKDFAARLKMEFVADGCGDLAETFGPEDVFNYMYAVFHSPAYRARYAEFLKIDFPRLPLTSQPELLRQLCALGARLVALHLMEEHAPGTADFPAAGSNAVEQVRYTAPGEHGHAEGRVWINREQYFANVPPEVWNFHVGGYQVASKWLKDRKGRTLSYDDLAHYRRTVAALAETVRLMADIDAAIEAHGGWPLR
jgi:predicted helicase